MYVNFHGNLHQGQPLLDDFVSSLYYCFYVSDLDIYGDLQRCQHHVGDIFYVFMPLFHVTLIFMVTFDKIK